MQSEYTLEDNARIAVIGGGPSGAFFSYFALRMAKTLGRNLNITIFEPKDFTQTGPSGCNMCGGLISQQLISTLEDEGIHIPHDLVESRINSCVLHTQAGNIRMKSPSNERNLVSVYRGGGPPGKNSIRGLDKYLLQLAVQEGAEHSPLRVDSIKTSDKPVIVSGGKEIMEADLVAGAFGINSTTSSIFEQYTGYKKPVSTSAFIAEIESDSVTAKPRGSLHVFLPPLPGNIKFASLIPKGNFFTLCVIGSHIDRHSVEEFLAGPVAGKVLLKKLPADNPCSCFPQLCLGSAHAVFSDRTVIIGEACSTTLFKDGIGSSCTTARAAAETAIVHGVSKEDFRRHYLPCFERSRADNRFGRFVHATTHTYKTFSLFTEALASVSRKEQEKSPEEFPRLNSMLWDTFTGSTTYRSIFMRGTNILMHIKLVLEFLKAVIRRIRQFI